MRGNGERGRGPSMDRKQERRIEAADRDEDLSWKGEGEAEPGLLPCVAKNSFK